MRVTPYLYFILYPIKNAVLRIELALAAAIGLKKTFTANVQIVKV